MCARVCACPSQSSCKQPHPRTCGLLWCVQLLVMGCQHQFWLDARHSDLQLQGSTEKGEAEGDGQLCLIVLSPARGVRRTCIVPTLSNSTPEHLSCRKPSNVCKHHSAAPITLPPSFFFASSFLPSLLPSLPPSLLRLPTSTFPSPHQTPSPTPSTTQPTLTQCTQSTHRPQPHPTFSRAPLSPTSSHPPNLPTPPSHPPHFHPITPPINPPWWS